MRTWSIGLCAVVMLVVLRIAIGWHFLYEGLHKLDSRNDFSAKGFLGMAKGPAAPFFHALLPDLMGHARLVIAPVVGADGKPTRQKTFPVYEEAWAAYYDEFSSHYGDGLAEAGRTKDAERVYQQCLTSLREMAADVEPEVAQYQASWSRFVERRGISDVAHVQQREWEDMMKFRSEVTTWLGELDSLSAALQNGLYRLYSTQLVSTETGEGELDIVTAPERIPIPHDGVQSQLTPLSIQDKLSLLNVPDQFMSLNIQHQLNLLNLSVALGLTAIGACLILGLCSGLASLGGVAFLTSVWLSQFPSPTVYPPTPDMVGHFLFVSKDLVELVALLVIASMPVGRWGGLDFFLWSFSRRVFTVLTKQKPEKERTAE